MKKEVLLYTAGIDSFIAREYLKYKGHEFDCLYFDYDGKYTEYEIDTIINNDDGDDVIIDCRLSLCDLEQPDAYIPNRNILFATLAVSLGYDIVWLGGSLSDRVCDNNSKVFQMQSKLLTEVNSRYCKIDSPFFDCYKSDMVKWYVNMKPDNASKLLNNTFSCFCPTAESTIKNSLINGSYDQYNTHECLNCAACFRKCVVLYSAGIYVKFENDVVALQYYTEFKNGLIQTPRSEATIKYVEQLGIF